MLISDAFAQAPAAAGADPFMATVFQLLPLVAIFGVFYFLMIRPQQARMKAHQLMVANVKRGDVIETTGGLIGKIRDVKDDELRVELAPNVEVRLTRGAISNVRTKGEPVPANDLRKVD